MFGMACGSYNVCYPIFWLKGLFIINNKKLATFWSLEFVNKDLWSLGNCLLLCGQLLLDLMAFREQALRLILDLSSTVITLLVSIKSSPSSCKMYSVWYKVQSIKLNSWRIHRTILLICMYHALDDVKLILSLCSSS